MKRWMWIIVGIVVLAGAVLGFRVMQENRANSALSNLQTEPIRMGSLEATIGATGRVRSNQTAELTFDTSGIVETVLVELGDEVRAGDVLATLKQTSLPSSVILAEAEMVSAQRELDALLKSSLASAQAQRELAQAQQALEDAERTWTVNQAGNRASTTTIRNARAELTVAEAAIDKAKFVYDHTPGNREEDAAKASAYKNVAAAQQRYDAALRNYNWYTGEPDEIDLAQLDADVAVAQARVDDAQREWERVKDGPDPADIAAAEARLAAAKATMEMAVIRAPFDGTITAVHIKPGDQAAPGLQAFGLDDLSLKLVDVEVSEVDINRVGVGQPVLINFDAILDRTFDGEVREVSPTGNSVQGVVNFIVTVGMPGQEEAVKPGMTAAITIIVDQIDDVLLVPNRAVRLLEGERVVYVIEGGELTPIPIELGSSSELYSEIQDGELSVGDEVVLNPPMDFNFGGPSGGGFGRGGS